MKQLTFPKLKEKSPLTVQVETELLERVRFICKDKDITLRQAVEYSLQLFIEASKTE